MARLKLTILISLVVLMSVQATSVLAATTGTGSAVASDANGLSDRINISMTDVAHPAEGKAYEGWLVSDDGETKTSLGVLVVSGGAISHEYISPTGENLIQNYDHIMITVEPVSDSDAAPSSDIVFSDTIPADAITHIRTLVKDSMGALRTQLDAAIAEATLAKDATTIADVVLHTNKAIALIDGDAGVLALADGVQTGADTVSVAVVDQVVDSHAILAYKYGKNAADWATLAKGVANDKVVNETDATVAKLFVGPGSETVLGYLNAARNGFGATGGAEQAYVEGQLMGSYSLGAAATPTVAVPTLTKSASISDANATSDRVNISMASVAHPAEGKAYEGWLVSDDGETKTSLGVLVVSGGAISHEYISPTGEDLIQNYDHIMITVEPVSDSDAAPSSDIVFNDTIPSNALSHIRTVTNSMSALRTQLDAAIAEATLAKDATTIADVVLHTNKAIALIDGDAGVLALAAARSTADSAAAGVDDSVIDSHAVLLDTYGKNAADWATLAKGVANDKVVNETDVTIAKLFAGPGSGTVLGYLNAARNGFGATGGAEQAYVEGQLMGSYVLADRPTSSVVLPSVGDQAVQLLMQLGLLSSLILLAAGVLVAMGGRSWRSHGRS